MKFACPYFRGIGAPPIFEVNLRKRGRNYIIAPCKRCNAKCMLKEIGKIKRLKIPLFGRNGILFKQC